MSCTLPSSGTVKRSGVSFSFRLGCLITSSTEGMDGESSVLLSILDEELQSGARETTVVC